MANHNGIVVTPTMQDIVVDAEVVLEADTSYMLENTGNQAIYLSRQDSVPPAYPSYYNIIAPGSSIGVNTGSDGEKLLVWVGRGSSPLSIVNL